MEGQLTYEVLFDALRREKSRDELQQLEREFFERVGDLLAGKQDAIRAAQAAGFDSPVAQRAQLEYQNIRKILKELYERRERKVLTLALHRARTDAAVIDTDALLPVEQRLFDDTVRLLLDARREAFSVAESRRLRPIAVASDAEEAGGAHFRTDEGAAEAGEHEMTVRFLAHVPKFVGKDLKVFGPYEEGTAETLPSDVAEILIRKGRAEAADS